MQPKRLIISLLVVILMFGAAVMSVAAAQSPFEITVETECPTAVSNEPVILQVGDELVYNIKIDSNPGVGLFTFFIEYNNDAFDVTSENGDLAYTWGDVYADAEKAVTVSGDRIKCYIFDQNINEDNNETGVLITFTFKVKEAFHGDANIEIVMDDSDAITNDPANFEVKVNVNNVNYIGVHNVVGEIEKKAADCVNKGTLSFTCGTCNEKIVIVTEDALGHTPGEAATCTTAQTCTVCQAEIEPAKGHTPGEAATCTTAQTCTVCQAEIAPATGHTVVVDEGVKPTYSKEGLTEGKHCSVCNEVLEAQEVIAKKSALWIWIVVIVAVLLVGAGVAFFFIKKKKN